MGREKLAIPQPNPVKGRYLVKQLVEEYISPRDYLYGEVMKDCVYKMTAGEEKYGSPLMTNNGRSADLDCYQDLLDTINYAVQAYYEDKDPWSQLDRDDTINNLLHVALRIRRRLEKAGIITEERGKDVLCHQ